RDAVTLPGPRGARDLGMEAVGTDLGWHIADPLQADLNGTHAHTNRSRWRMAIAITAVLTRPLISGPAKELVNLGFKRVLEHLARCLTDQPLEDIVRRRHGARSGTEPDIVSTRRNSPLVGPVTAGRD